MKKRMCSPRIELKKFNYWKRNKMQEIAKFSLSARISLFHFTMKRNSVQSILFVEFMPQSTGNDPIPHAFQVANSIESSSVSVPCTCVVTLPKPYCFLFIFAFDSIRFDSTRFRCVFFYDNFFCSENLLVFFLFCSFLIRF